MSSVPTPPAASSTRVMRVASLPDATTPARKTTTTGATRRIGMVSTYPPKLCGLATFAAALGGALVQHGHVVEVVRLADVDDPVAPDDGRTLTPGSPRSLARAAIRLSHCDVVVLQHEYGVFGGEDGDEVIDLLRAITVPSIVVLHTVPVAPTAHQQLVLEAVCALADRTVVMTTAARSRLLAGYDVDAERIDTIPHGAATPRPVDPLERRHGLAARPQLLTWGLLGPGKGIEHVIAALALLRDVRPKIRYTIAGVTHPKVLARDGDRYRESLVKLAWELGVASSVTFDDTYRDVEALTRFVASASVVVLPYDSHDQVTSGVLVDAIAAGRPVIATAFPHASELLADGAGTVVPHADPAALAAAIHAAVTDPEDREAMAAAARALAPSLHWPAVAARYVTLCDELLARSGAQVDASVAT